jgi:hypothetical protein
MLLRQLPDKAHDLPASRQVKSTGRLVQEQNLRTRHELCSHTDSPLLAA